ncbi:MAG: hypothetical protein AB1925_03855 [Actinomycetota bacterium]
MAISYSFVNTRHAQALLREIAQFGIEPPEALTSIIGAHEELAKVTAARDPMADLVKAIAAGSLRGDELEKQVDRAADELHRRQFRADLRAHVEPAIVRQFVNAVDEGGGADEIIDSLRPAFGTAAAKLIECAELVDANADPEVFLASASAEQIKAWQAIDEHVATLTKVSTIASHFGPHSTSFPLLEIPANVGNLGFINNNGVMCVDAKYGLDQACRLFQNHGNHRNSPWFRGASVLRLNTIAEAREKIRAWAEASWDSLNSSQGRGRIVDGQFIPEPLRNPYAVAQ